MSTENVELVKALYEAQERGNLAAALEAIGPDVVWISSPGAVPRCGLEAFVESLAEWGETWEGYESRVEEYLDAGDRVVVVSRLRARGGHSGVEVASRIAILWTLESGKLVRGEVFDSKEEALAAAGIRT